MIEHPILFSDAMVRAILEGRKTQTRRVVKLNPLITFDRFEGGLFFSKDSRLGIAPRNFYGQPGDRLWVRETFAYDVADYPDGRSAEAYVYRATTDCEDYFKGKWTPSIYMPRCASRLTLKITEVSVQRVQEISEQDAKAEGVDFVKNFPEQTESYLPFRAEFGQLWDSINDKRGFGWDKNPWVWCISFKRISP